MGSWQVCLVCMLLGVLGVTSASAQSVLVRGGDVQTLTGPIAPRTDVLVRDGKIAAVGRDLQIADDVRVIDAAGRIVTPGFMAGYSRLGLLELSVDEASRNDQVRSNFPYSAALRAADGINPDSVLIPITRIAGVTRAVTASYSLSENSIGRLFSGAPALIQLDTDREMVLDAAPGLVATFRAGKRGAGGTRIGEASLLRANLQDARDYRKQPARYRAGRGRALSLPVEDLAALQPLLRGEVPLAVQVDNARDILLLMKIAAEFRIALIIVGGAEAWRVADRLSEQAIPVILYPFRNLPMGLSSFGPTAQNAARLHAAGVQIAFYTPNTHMMRLLPQLAGNAVAHGLPYDAALAAVTRNPAEIWGIGSSFGTIEEGKDADLVVWDGDPFELSTQVEALLIRGQSIPLESRMTQLRDRYRHLENRRLPIAYPH